MGLLLFVLLCICSFFFLSRFFVKVIPTAVKHKKFIFGIRFDNDKLYHEIENWPSPV